MQPAVSHPPRYLVFYDANCRLCVRSRRMLERLRPRAELVFVDVGDEGVMARYSFIDRAARLGQMHVMDSAGRLAGGYDAFLLLAPAVPLLRPLRQVLQWRPVRFVGHKLYRWVARNRYRLGGSVSCEGGACRIAPAHVNPPPASAPRPPR